MNDGSRVMRIDREVAELIKRTQRVFKCSSVEASVVVFNIKNKKLRGRPRKSFWQTSPSDYDIQLVYNPKYKQKHPY